MAKQKDDPQIKRFRKLRRFFDRRVVRARVRRRRTRIDDARKQRSTLKVIRRNRSKKNLFLRKIRHRRKVLSRKGLRDGLVWFDGVKMAKWVADELLKARKAGRWKGHAISGWRDPVYSESLCYAICGAPACAGICAGRASNHSGIYFPKGAADCTDAHTLQDESKRLNLRIKNALPNDRPHFSNSGR